MEQNPQPEGQIKKCPKCREDILKSAKRCKHCQGDLRNWFARHKVMTGILVIIVLIIIASAGGKKDNGDNKTVDSNPASPNTAAEQAKEQKYKMNDKVPVGHFLFSVGSVKDLEEISDGFTKKKAAGIYKLIGIAAINTDKESRYLDNSMFKLLDNKGRIYDNSTEGSMAVSIKSNGEMDLFLKQISPSLGAGGVLVFDVPEDAEGFRLEVSGGFGSLEKRYIELQ